MSSGGNNNTNDSVKGTSNTNQIPNPATANLNLNDSANNSANSSISLTPRFTNEEKEILYGLFHLHEEVIDIKYRKKQKGKYSVRDAWQQIVNGFNGHPGISTQRNLKQIQKFWLNARLRKQYPFHPSSGIIKTSPVNRRTSVSNTGIDIKPPKSLIPVPAPIKCEPEYALTGNDTPDTTHNAEEYEEIELHTNAVSNPLTVESIEDSIESDHNEEQITQQAHQQQEQQHQQQQNTIHAQQINVDQISADKLTLNDLLHFKNTRPREEIILQIKHPDGGSITLPSPTRITIPHQQTYNQIISEIKTHPQQQQHIQLQHYPTQQVQQTTAHTQIQQQQYNGANSTFCTYTTQHLPHVSAPSAGPANTSSGSTSFLVTDSFEDKINYFKLKEAELRHKELQLQLEQKRIDVSRMQEELKHQKEMHRLQVDEMKIKIRILTEEERRLRNKES